MRKLVAPAILLGLLVVVRLCNGFVLGMPLEVTTLQLVCFPIVCFAALVFVPTRNWIIKALIAAIGLIGSLLAINSHFHVLRPHGTIFFSRLSGDVEDSMTREFLTRVEEAAVSARATVYLQQHFESIPTAKEAAAALDVFKKANAIVYGSKRWLQVYLNEKHFPAPVEVPMLRVGRPAVVVTYVPEFGMSADPMEQTATFLGLFFGGLEAGATDEKLRLLDTAANMKAGWTLYGHSAYALWLSATLTLLEALKSAHVDVTELKCAFSAFSQAQGHLHPQDNPLLLAAIVNNKGIISELLYQMQQQDAVTPTMIDQEMAQILKSRKTLPPGVANSKIFKLLEKTKKSIRFSQPKRERKSPSPRHSHRTH